MRFMLLEHMDDNAPKLKARLTRTGELNDFVNARVDEALRILQWNLHGLTNPDPNRQAMARELAVADLFDYPKETDAY